MVLLVSGFWLQLVKITRWKNKSQFYSGIIFTFILYFKFTLRGNEILSKKWIFKMFAHFYFLFSYEL